MAGSARDKQLNQALALCGPFAAAMFLCADVVGTLTTPEYSPVGQAISELIERQAPAKALVDPLLIVYHGLVVPFAFGLYRGLPNGPPLYAGPLLIGLAGAAGVVLTLFFPCDPGCAPFVSLRGTLHIFIAIPMGFAILIGIWLSGRRLRGHKRLSRYTYGTAFLGLVLAVLTVALAEASVVGLVERLLTWSYLQWYVVTGLLIWHRES
jgi:hypothetical protein